MTKYQYRNAIVTAWQYNGGDIHAPLIQVNGDPQVHLRTKDGPVVVQPSDWIVTQADNRIILVKDEEFQKEYAIIEDDKPADKTVKPAKPLASATTKPTETKEILPALGPDKKESADQTA